MWVDLWGCAGSWDTVIHAECREKNILLLIPGLRVKMEVEREGWFKRKGAFDVWLHLLHQGTYSALNIHFLPLHSSQFIFQKQTSFPSHHVTWFLDHYGLIAIWSCSASAFEHQGRIYREKKRDFLSTVTLRPPKLHTESLCTQVLSGMALHLDNTCRQRSLEPWGSCCWRIYSTW